MNHADTPVLTDVPPNDYTAAFVLASLVAGYPDQEFEKNARLLWSELSPAIIEADPWKSFEEKLLAILESPDAAASAVRDLCSEYIELFDRGRAYNPIHETEFGRARSMFKTTELADISGFYRAFGVELGEGESSKELPDHVAVELQFYAILLMKQTWLEQQRDEAGVAIVLDARRKFLADHLGRFVDVICECSGVRGSSWYGAAFRWIAHLVRTECELLGVTPDRVSLLPRERESEEVNCGAASLRT